MPSPRDTLASTVAAEAALSLAAHDQDHPEPSTALVLGDLADSLALALESAGGKVTRWHRHLTPSQAHSPWPPSGSFGQVWIRLPRSGLEVKMLLAAASTRVAPDGAIVVFGAKDEGIRSVDKHLPPSLTPFTTHLVKRRCRVLLTRPDLLAAQDEPEEPVEAWRSETTLDWGQGPRTWVHYPGMFAHGRLDAGTALLIDHLPALGLGAQVLDFGAGTGVIGGAALELGEGVQLTMVDSDALALAAAKVNVPAASHIKAGTDLSDLQGPYDLVVSNPPIHDGKAETLKFVTELVRQSAGILAPAGRLLVVVQRRLPIASVLETSFSESSIVADEGPFRVWEASAPKGSR